MKIDLKSSLRRAFFLLGVGDSNLRRFKLTGSRLFPNSRGNIGAKLSFVLASSVHFRIFVQKISNMIQRIQTVYMLIAAILIGLLFTLPFAEIADAAGKLYVFDIRGIVHQNTVTENGMAIAGLIGLILLLHVGAIFMYKRRILQIRFLVLSILLSIGLFGMFYFFTYYAFDDANISFKISVAFPIVAIILDYLAIRGIGKDEALIRSMDRIR